MEKSSYTTQKKVFIYLTRLQTLQRKQKPTTNTLKTTGYKIDTEKNRPYEPYTENNKSTHNTKTSTAGKHYTETTRIVHQ